jgi:chaperonin cofactor prefoldin
MEDKMDDIETRYKDYATKREKVLQSKMKLEAALSERKKNLREAMEECKKMGYNPDTLAEDLKKMKEVLLVKLSVCEADLSAAEEQLAPMLKEIE